MGDVARETSEIDVPVQKLYNKEGRVKGGRVETPGKPLKKTEPKKGAMPWEHGQQIGGDEESNAKVYSKRHPQRQDKYGR